MKPAIEGMYPSEKGGVNRGESLISIPVGSSSRRRSEGIRRGIRSPARNSHKQNVLEVSGGRGVSALSEKGRRVFKKTSRGRGNGRPCSSGQNQGDCDREGSGSAAVTNDKLGGNDLDWRTLKPREKDNDREPSA